MIYEALTEIVKFMTPEFINLAPCARVEKIQNSSDSCSPSFHELSFENIK